jgi:uncharacterized circularly permuted ATP-grasp superfamily protein/uncharacterized alpha-E superfamily protein
MPEDSTPRSESVLARTYAPPAGVYDELKDASGVLRPHWHALLSQLDTFGGDELARRWERARHLLHENGVSYNVYGDPQGMERPWNLSLIPVVISADEWHTIEAGLVQRARLLDALLRDLYGPQRVLLEGLVPPQLVFENPRFLRACHNMSPPGNTWLPLYAADLLRLPSGGFAVLEDRTQAPSGAGYTLENRIVISNVLPEAFRQCQVERLAPFFRTMRDMLQALAPHNRDNPRIVVLTPGPYNATYFEQAYLAQYLGYTLVNGGDLTVRGDRVFLKTLGGLQPVDVILRRVNDDYCDPLELRPESVLGVPGLTQAARSGNVVIANPLGAGLLQTHTMLPYFERLSRALLGEELELPSVRTWWCGDPGALREAEASFHDVVVKPAFQQGFLQPVFTAQLDPRERAELLAQIRNQPSRYVIQEHVRGSTTPALTDTASAFRGGAAGDDLAPVLRGGAAGKDKDLAPVLRGGGASKDLAPALRGGGASKDLAPALRGGAASKDLAPALRGGASIADTELIPRALVMRCFAVAGRSGYVAMPGALARVAGAEEGTEFSMQLGAGSKDTWVLSRGTVTSFSLLPPPHRAVALSRGGGDLPSRAADNLYWLGRYAERAEAVARLARVVCGRLHDLATQSELDRSSEIAPLLRALMAQTALVYTAPLATGTDVSLRAAEQQLLFAVFGEEGMGTLKVVLRSTLRSGRLVRDRISTDTWRVLAALDDELNAAEDELEANPLGSTQDVLNRLVLRLAAFSGLVMDSMTRGQAWRFLEMGRRLERAMGLVMLLRGSLIEPCDREGPLLESVLETADSSMTYRRRYLTTLQVAPVVDLLLTDETNPRSILYQMDEFTRHIEALPVTGKGLRTHEQRIALSVLTDLKLADIERVCSADEDGRRPRLEALLIDLATRIPALSDSLSDRYLTHATVTRHLTQDEKIDDVRKDQSRRGDP